MRRFFVFICLGACVEYEFTQFDVVDTFTQDPPAQVDVLVVVDNSFSMEPYQEKLSTNFNAFVSFFQEANVDYHIGAITTNIMDTDHGVSNGCTPQQVEDIPPAGQMVNDVFITQDTNNADEVFRDLVSAGVCGSGLEMGLEAAWLALNSEHPVNKTFFRKDASLSVLFVSDEEDGSPLPVRQYVDDMRDMIKGRDRQRFNISALVFDEGDGCDEEESSFAARGDRYLEATRITGGVQGDICAPNYDKTITDVSLAAARLSDTFFLSDEPNVDTLLVEVGGVEQPCTDGTWSFTHQVKEGEDAPAIVFARSALPPSGEDILVRYIRGDGNEDNFCLGGSTTATQGEESAP
jgi:hypothetical protein